MKNLLKNKMNKACAFVQTLKVICGVYLKLGNLSDDN